MSYADNVYALINQLTPEDWEIGTTWYSDVRAWVKVQAQAYQTHPAIVCQVIAALSPRLSWSNNLKDARTVLQYADHPVTEYDLPTQAFRTNVRKALDIARGNDALNGLKVTAFQDNILNANSQAVTVDVWMIRIAEGNLALDAGSPTPLQYEAYARVYREIAEDMGIAPYVLQAVLWTAARRIADLGNNNKPKVRKDPVQLTFLEA